MGRPRRVSEADIPACPRHGLNFRRTLSGFYGRTRRRQRYVCFPLNDRSHTFVETLPLQQPHDGRYPWCAQHLANPHHGFPGPRKHHYTAREIAQALIAVGSGQSYTASGKGRRRAVGRRSAKGVYSDDASLVMDWVETFAPVLEQALLPRAWPSAGLFDRRPRAGVVLVDDLPFHIRAWKTRSGGTRTPKQSGRRIFSILAAAYYPGEQLRILRLHAVPTATSEDRWAELLTRLPVNGYPPQVLLSDGAAGLNGALRRVWGDLTAHAFCVYHYRRQVEVILPPSLRTTPQRRAVIAGLALAFTPPVTNFDAWAQHAGALHLPLLVRWLDRKSAQIRRQLSWTYWPVSIGGLEVRLQKVKAMLDRRRWSYRNQQRMNRLLALVALHLNEQDDEERYVELIERHLRANCGRPYWIRHTVYDRRGQPPSLRRAA